MKTKSKAQSPKPKESSEERVSVECGFCGKKGGAYVSHYDRVRCDCGHYFWALRPRQDGPLVLVPWPGEARRAA